MDRSDSRPLSPFTTIWRWHVTMVTSILHRASGVALYGGVFVLVAWLVAVAAGETQYMKLMTLMASMPGKVLLFGFTLSLSFHLLNGVRYLFWGRGIGYDKAAADRSAWLVIALSAVLTLFLWGLAFGGFGLLQAGG
jgi:succinate dehydrogenase cytochrome b subunit